MDTEAVLGDLVRFGEAAEWVGLWMIATDVKDLLGVSDLNKNLDITLVLVRELLKRGFRAGNSPAQSDGVHFAAWPDQDADAVVDFIRREWAQKAELPSWGDCPWFARRCLSLTV
jgi:hypothetical protein